MTARRVSVPLASMVAAIIGCSPPATSSSAGETSSSTDTGESTDTCVAYGLTPNEAYSGVSLATLMLPESRGGTNLVAGSCGGGGVEEGTLVTAPETAYYHLWVNSSGTFTTHVHSGDSCDGPELACETGAWFDHYLMLEAGESVVIVVDTEAEQEIPEPGLEYSVGVDFAPPPPRPCEQQALEQCNEGPVAALAPCMAGYTCGDFDTFETCHAQLADGLRACHDEFCPDDPVYLADCVAACEQRRDSCECEHNICEYEWQLCAETCSFCYQAIFEFEYADACELALPGPRVDPTDFYWVEIGSQRSGEFLPVAAPGLACDDPGVQGAIWSSESTVMLCQAACEAFALAGTTWLAYLLPCE